MKRLLAAIILGISVLSLNSYSQGGMGIGFRAGLSTPNDEVGNVYNKDKLKSISNGDESIYDAVYQTMDMGYHLGVELRMPSSDFIAFKGGIMFNSFPENEIEVVNPSNETNKVYLKSSTNVIPVYAGLNFTFLDLDFISFYATGELAYNYISSSIDYKDKNSGMSIPISTSESESRGGFGFGAGFDLDIKILELNLEAKYNNMNLINRVDGEESKSYVTVGLGVYFM